MNKEDKRRADRRKRSNIYRISNPKKYYKDLKIRVSKWRKENPEKIKASRKIFVELRAGRMKRGICFCGIKKVEAHHTDYAKPLEVIWLCKKHHRLADRMPNRIIPKEYIKIILNELIK